MIEQRVLAVIASWPRPQRYYLAFSGGRDSSVLLDILANNRERLPAELALIHVNHGLQPEAADWCQHCQDVAQSYGLPISIELAAVQHDQGWGPEMAARKARLAVWQRCLPPDSMLLLAHHQRDQAETTLLNAMRSGRAVAMPALRRTPDYWLARPLLACGYAQIEAYAAKRRLSWVEDPSNAEDHYARNYLRNQVLPGLRARWPQAERHLAGLGAQSQAQAALGGQAVRALLARLASNGLPKLALQGYSPELRQELLSCLLDEHGLPRASRKQLAEFDRQVFEVGASRAELELGKQALRLRRGLISCCHDG